MAQTIKLKRSGTSGRLPTTSDLELGEVAINTYDGKMYIKKNVGGTESIVEIGGQGGGIASSFTLYEYTATSGQTTFSGSDGNSNTLAYDTGTPPKILVYLNGVLLDHTTDYTATNGTSVVLTNGAATNDLLQIAAYKSSVSTTLDIDLSDTQKILFGDDDDLEVYHNGSNGFIKNTTGDLYIEDSNGSIRLRPKTGESGINIFADAGVELYYDNAKKLETTSTGVDVTGDVLATSFTLENGANRSLTGPQNEDLLINARPNDAAEGLHLQINGADKLLINQAGNVGIGTSSPADKLHISGGNLLLNNALEIRTKDTGGNLRTVLRANSSNELEYGWSASGPVKFMGGGAYTERMRIDSSGNLLVGKTANNTFNEGFVAKAAGGANITANQANVLDLNRRNNNGDIVIFRKDNTQVGSIAVNSGYIGVGAGAVYLGYYTDGSNNKSIIPMSNSTGSAAAGTIGLGINNANHKFKDAWITGAVNSGSISTGTISSGAITSSGTITAPTLIAGAYGAGGSAGDGFRINSTDIYGQVDSTDKIHISAVTGNISAISGHVSGKFAVKSTAVHASYDFYNNGTTYLNGSTTIDDVLDITGSSASLRIGGTEVISTGRNLSNIGTISSGNITTSGYLAGPATFTIDPAAVGDNTGTVVIAGNLQVDGTTTTINSTTLTVDDKNITLASGSSNAAAANGAGLTVDCGSGTDATLTYDGTNDEWDFNKNVKVSGSVGVTNIVTNKVVKFNGTILDDSIITDNGTSVGISQSSPSSTYKLDVAGAIRSAAAAPSFALQETDSSNQTWLFGSYSGTAAIRDITGSTYPLQIEAATPSNTLYLDSTGNVGIGTTNPGRKLTIEGTSNAYIKTDATSHTSWTIGSDTYGFLIYDDDVGGTDGYRIVVRQNSGNVGVGTTQPQAKFQVEEAGIETTTTSTTATTQVAIDSFQASAFRSARYTIQVTNSTDSTYHLTEILLIHDGTTPQITEYGTIFTGSAEATFDADISSGNVRLLATPATTDSMTFKVVRHCITV